ncbi:MULTISPECIES: enoyl-CoA hydratase/isomerase family protein [unclassified Janthinobacterium]|uniref:enoyl-CoA hydratase/isomerase family protein n=1 Tax=unclassified Janthinobacterium TaxID=2610881 RepID=UPI0003457E16|nr:MULTISPECIES: enoyl-CoA hydratase/isomerase family protein [unclassified Janthinobacterium]MEC5162727.1 3,2-trans-enoyl-CoA isomerase [Janthinobacterium sp. CG_S6]
MIDIIPHGEHIVEFRLAAPPVNAMDVASLRALNSAFSDATAAGRQGVILSGVPGIFSSGIDVIALLDGDAAAVRDYWTEVFTLAARMALAPMPVVAAIGGHCVAAGTLLALFSDYRIMARGDWGIGLNEVRAGVTLPDCFQLALRRAVGPLGAERMLVSGSLLDPARALALGLVDELAAPDEVVARARDKLLSLLALPRHAMLSTRAIARADLRDAFADVDALPVAAFVDAFLEPRTQAALRQVAGAIKRKLQGPRPDAGVARPAGAAAAIPA